MAFSGQHRVNGSPYILHANHTHSLVGGGRIASLGTHARAAVLEHDVCPERDPDTHNTYQ